MDDINVWRDRLYPAEWGFRFFITATLVWMAGRWWHEPVAMVVFYLLTLGVLVAFAIQVWVILEFFRGTKEDAVTHQ